MRETGEAQMQSDYDFAVVGGGIVGLSTGMALGKRFPHARVLILEKEDAWAKHQTGHNSGVIHSGIYYRPGTYKAQFAISGNHSMVKFCAEHGIAHDVCGKIIVATDQSELPLLENLYERGLQHKLPIRKISADELKEIEPHVRALSAIHVPSTGIVDYAQVCNTYAQIIEKQGGHLHLGTTVLRLKETTDSVRIETTHGEFTSKFLVNCAGLQSDRIAKLYGIEAGLKIVPFRGEYYELKPEKRYLVKHLIYPVPNPSFPFLGVHFTRMIGGHVEAGPNAVLAFKREGYKKTDFNWSDFTDTMTYRGFWILASRYWKEGSAEMIRSMSKTIFVRSLQRLIPEIQADDLIPAPAGVRAQALKADGSLVDDFHLIKSGRSIHVCNAPSPAATASLEIGQFVANDLGPAFCS
jgi:L-2-hydroxyglutarate oxidase